MQVRDVMTSTLVRAGVGDAILDAFHLMAQRGVHHLLVYDGDRLAGIVSDRDLRFIHPSRAWQQPDEVMLGLVSMTLGQALSSHLVAIAPDASLADAAALMLDRHVSALVVGEPEEMILGVVTSTDLLEVLAERQGPAVPARGAYAGNVSDAYFRSLLRPCRTVAVVGLSPDPEAAPDVETTKLLALPLRVFAIHPRAGEVLGLRCYRSLAEVPEHVDVLQVFPGAEVDLHHLANEAVRQQVKVFWYEDVELPESVVELLRLERIAVVAGRSLQAAYFTLVA